MAEIKKHKAESEALGSDKGDVVNYEKGSTVGYDKIVTVHGATIAEAAARAKLVTEIQHLKLGEINVIFGVVKGLQKTPIEFHATVKSGARAELVIKDHEKPGAFEKVISDRMLSAVPRHDAAMADWNELIGPFYDTAALTSWLGVSKQAISKRIGKTLLAVRAENGDVRYPSFQFLDDGRVIPDFMFACKKLAEVGLDEWAQAQWMNTPVPEMGDRTFAAALAQAGVADNRLVHQLIDIQAARLAA